MNPFRQILRPGLLVIAALWFAPTLFAEEPFATNVIAQILATRAAILERAGPGAETSTAFLAFWDFDGTTIKGDCSEGLKDGDATVYPGLAQVMIEHGLSSLYPREGGFARFWTDYTNLDARVGHWLAYPFIPQMLRGAKAADVMTIGREQFTHTMRHYLMASSVRIMGELERRGVQSHIVSASADLFVKCAAASLGLPEQRMHGIEVRIRDGLVTDEIIYPVTWNRGKLEKIKAVVERIERDQPGVQVFILAGFGDSYHTDGPFLDFIARQTLPAGRPVSVFFNSKGEPDEYRGLFLNASHTEIVGPRK